jgi:membrane-associated protease RseP (regulator of RpoE activity)
MGFVVGVLVLLVGLLVSIGLHEVGHMYPAKKFGVRVSQYFVGFGPTLWSRHGRETEYGIKAIPLGGYVRLVGMIPPADAVKPVRGTGWASRLIETTRADSVDEILEGEEHRAFYRLTWWKKVIVMAGGPLVNLVLAIVIFTGVLSVVGTPTQTLTVASVVDCIPAAGASECAPQDPASPAREAGIVAGDTVVSIDGVPVADWPEATAIIAASPGEPLDFVIDRNGEPVSLSVTPGVRERAVYDESGTAVTDASGAIVTEQVGFLGVYSEVQNEPQPVWAGAVLTWDYLGQTVNVVVNLPQHLYHVTRAALGLEERDPNSVIGVVGVGRVAGEISADPNDALTFGEQIASMMMLLGGLNLALFVFNMIPLLPLDGGHIASAVWQGIKNGWAKVRGLSVPAPVDVARMMPFAYGMFALLLAMGVLLIYADIVAPVSIV